MNHDDLIVKHRPRFFRDFWQQQGPVATIAACIRNNRLPKGLLIAGGYGTGKSSLGRTVARSASCPERTTHEPCGECPECQAVLDGHSWNLSAMLIRGNDFSADRFRAFMDHWRAYGPMFSCAAEEKRPAFGVCVVDEAHHLDKRAQAMFLDHVEDAQDTCFIFCTTREDEVIDALRDRCHPFTMERPTEQECCDALARIARLEGMNLEDGEVKDIVRRGERNPRRCLRTLQSRAMIGAPLGTDSANDSANDSPLF